MIAILQYNLNSIVLVGVGAGDLLAAGIAIAMSFCGLASVAAAGRMLFAFARDDGVPGVGLAEEGVAPLPDAGERPDRDRRRRLGVHRRWRGSSAAGPRS